MEKLLAYDKKHCQISYLEDAQCIYLKWMGFASFEPFKEACDFALELMIRQKTSKMIADNRLAEVLPMESENWMTQHWFPKAFEAGYRTSAVIISQDIFNELAVKDIVNQMDQEKFTVKYFTDLEAAKAWLQEISN